MAADVWLCAHLSDPHIVEPGCRAAGIIDTGPFLSAAVARLNGLDPQPDLVLATGDLVNDARPGQYRHLADLVAPLRAPLRLLPGNHDDRDGMRTAFPGHDYLPDGPTLDYVVDGPVRVIALDTLIPGSPSGRLSIRQLAWLDATLAEQPATPTVVALHHPPFASGIAFMDRMGLDAGPAARLADVVSRHPHVERVVCGHLHRAISRRFAGTIAATVPGLAHAVALDLEPRHAPGWTLEPPAITLYLWRPQLGLVTHQIAVGPYPEGRFGGF
jgi:3',5'-cyclic AMP phosphodiesterase CpdA